MFERFTGEAREVVRLAQEEARRLHHPSIGTEHLLLALAAGQDGTGRALRDRGLGPDGLRPRITAALDVGLDAQALATVGIDLDEVRRAAEASFGPGALARAGRPAAKGHLPLSDRSKKVLELSLREAQRLRSGHIGSGHLLLGLLREGGGLACRVLTDAGADLDALRDETAARLTAGTA
ncbi:Clp protease N-terminal domain-containing protein [Streptomyces sp. NPDC001380]|uniref:Clp protease N-terminal domain-containing protein n=1 Tax=Streptomyces sp. NPDC001380 TaxID=3364566 RepID=UPI0036BDFB44